jgi:hypothetical protein
MKNKLTNSVLSYHDWSIRVSIFSLSRYTVISEFMRSVHSVSVYSVYERRNRTLLDMVCSMMSNVTLLKIFWRHTLETAALIINRVSSKSVEKTPNELWFGKVPNMSYLKIYGCEIFIKHRVLHDSLLGGLRISANEHL